jgi:hypothetical protein
MGSKFRLALVQLAVGTNKTDNVARAVARVGEAARAGAHLVSLPECFNSPYGTQHFAEYSEAVPSGPSCQALARAAREHRVGGERGGLAPAPAGLPGGRIHPGEGGRQAVQHRHCLVP